MPQSGSIATHLPYLRRFARALTGSQGSGDAYAVATLEAIAEDGGHASVSKQSLFHVFAFHDGLPSLPLLLTGAAWITRGASSTRSVS